MKTLVTYRPNSIQNTVFDFDRYFGSFFGNSMLAPTTKTFKHMPAVDVRETETAYLLDMELPGFDEKNIEIHVDGSSLSIASKQEETKEEKSDEQSSKGDQTWVLRERRVSSFSRSFKLPENANPEEVTAEFKNGILSMEIKKRAEAQKRAIEIKAK